MPCVFIDLSSHSSRRSFVIIATVEKCKIGVVLIDPTNAMKLRFGYICFAVYCSYCSIYGIWKEII